MPVSPQPRSSAPTTAASSLQFDGDEPAELLIERAGRMPLPPYIASKRPADAADRDDYQTMFARAEGAVAAPTAALHFTPRLIEALDARGIGRETLTLHVGAGTFLPVKADNTADHRMHAEWGSLTQRRRRPAQRRPRAWRPADRGRHDVAAADRKRCRRTMA